MRILYVSRAPPDANGKGVERRAAQHLAALQQLGRVTLILPGSSVDEFYARGGSLENLELERLVVRRESTIYDVSAKRYWDETNRFAKAWYRLRQRYWVDQRAVKIDIPKYREDLSAGFDLLFAFRLSSAVWADSVLDMNLKLPIRIVDFDDIQSLAYARIQKGATQTLVQRIETWLHTRWLRKTEARFAKSWDRIAVCSQHDREYLAGRLGVDAMIVPNAVPFNMRMRPTIAGRPSILFVGTMNYPPNIDGILWFVNRVWPRVFNALGGDVSLTIAGIAPPEAILRLNEVEGIEVTGYVEDLTPLYDRATVVIAPIFTGGGTRIKILEAMAHARAVLTTSLGCEGLGVESGRHMFLADSVDSFSIALLRLVNDCELRNTVAEAGWHYGRANFASDVVQDALSRDLAAIVAGTATM